ncbi:MAG: DUF565 domain-containing protein [Leptolyngbyaceae cyanobacterium SM2_3_12]|nr:DUF565 domain-containing protein [Leptolyngbyaceae cyanobacterium SM2_3_12]
MQRTRFSTLIDDLSRQFSLWVLNPWRRVSLVLLSLLFGYFFGVSISAIAGQAAVQDVTISLILVLLAEVISWVVYSRSWRDPERVKTIPKPLWLDSLNSFKLGAVYAFCLEAFKLGS